MTEYTPSMMAAFTSDKGAGSVTELPLVAMAWKPKSSKSVPKKMYAPAAKT